MSESSLRARHRIVSSFMWASVPILVVLGFVGPMGPAEALGLPAAVAALGLVSARLTNPAAKSQLTSFALILAAFVAIELSGGQVHSHLFLLSVVAIVALYQSWLPLLVTVGAVVIHHLTLGLMAPTRVFNMSMSMSGDMSGMSGHHMSVDMPFLSVLTMVLVHAAAVLLEVAGLLLMWRFAEESEIEAEKSRLEAAAVQERIDADQVRALRQQTDEERQRAEAHARVRAAANEHAEGIRARVDAATDAVSVLDAETGRLRSSIGDVAQRCRAAATTAVSGQDTATAAA